MLCVDFLRVAPAVVCRAGDVPWLLPLAEPWPDHWACDRRRWRPRRAACRR